jgi:hypothetical protein
MKKQSVAATDRTERAPHPMRLPGFLIEEDLGLGDLIKNATYAMGIPPCSGCEKRAAVLNRWMVFSRSDRYHKPVL